MTDFKARLRDLAMKASASVTPTPQSVISGTGMNIVNPAVMSQAIESEGVTRGAAFKTAYAGILDRIKYQEENLAEEKKKRDQFSSDFMKDLIEKYPTVYSSMTDEDFASVQAGRPSAELITKITAAEKAGAKRETQIVEMNGRSVLVDTQTGETIKDFGQKGGGTDVKTQVVDIDGKKTLINSATGETIKVLNPSDKNDSAIIKKDQLAKADILLGNIDSAIALIPKTSGLGSLDPTASLTRKASSWIPGTDSYDLNRYITTIKANLGFDQLQKMRDASPTGGALGQVSERELDYLQSTVVSLDLGQKTETLKENLDKIKASYERWKQTVEKSMAGEGETTGGGKGTYYNEYTQNGKNYVQEGNTVYLVNPDESLMEVGQAEIPKADEVSAASETKRVANAIGEFESGGNYEAMGPVVTSGMYKGDRAVGKYQVMGKNVPSWTKEALGFSMTAEDFKNSPEAQDAVAEYRMGKLLAQGYPLEDIASIWFTGRPLEQGKDAKDVLGTTGEKYAKSIRAIYDRNA
ncbi:MAG: hypothetical protein M0Q43_11340 [Methanothrix sp.]|jgi:hypothetical protein|nr:hypothetical protein [Methanothrix sp.]